MNLGEVAANLGINWKLFLAQLINFGIIFWVLKRYAFSPIIKVLEERQNKINKGLEDAQKAETNLMMAEERYKQEIERARIEANKIIARAQKEKQETVDRAKSQAQEETRKIVTEAKEAIGQEKQKMLNDVQQEVIELTFLAAEKILQKELDPKSNREFVEKLIANRKNEK